MLLTARSFAEYEAMFDLDEQALDGRVLDCCAGASSFVAEHVARGGDGLAIDPVYASSGTDLASAISNGLGAGTQIIDQHPDAFEWGWYGTVERREAIRREAAAAFLRGRRSQPGQIPGRRATPAASRRPVRRPGAVFAPAFHLV